MCELSDLVAEYEAKQRWGSGESPCFSSNIVDQVTCGYGKLSTYGEWQFPLRPANKYLKLVKRRLDERGELPFIMEQPRNQWPPVYTIE